MKALGVRSLLILSIVLTLVSAVITYLNVQQKKESTDLVIHTYKVIQASTRLLSLLKDMETGHHGYLITGDTIFLSPYREALQSVDRDIDTLVTLVRENPHQKQVLEETLIPMVNRKRAHLEGSLAILNSFGRDSASHFAELKIAKARMDSIRALTLSFIEFEQTLLSQRSASLEERYFINDVIRFTSFALIGFTSFAALNTIRDKEKANKRLMFELEQFNQQLEEKVRARTQELEAANRDLVRLNDEKNHFLSVTTHDLKTPLAGISGLLNLMRTEEVTLSDRHLQYIQLMSETCENMLHLISDLLDLSRIEQGTISLNYQEIDAGVILKGLEERFHPWAGRKNIALNFEHSSNHALLRTDRDILNRILDNLLSNAIKFSPPGKKVTVSFHGEDAHYKFVVEDQGPGILKEEQHKLFKRFQKLSARPTDGENSSGLGLSIAKELVEMLNGSIDVKSEPGQGTRFTILMPAGRA